MSSPNVQDPLGQVLVDFSVKGAFPAEEALSAAYVDSSTVSAALAALDLAKAELEVCFSSFNAPSQANTSFARMKFAKSAETLPQMSISGSSMRNPSKTI